MVLTIAGTAPNPAGTTSSHNVLLANGTDGVLGVYNSAITPTLADWQLATEAAKVSASAARGDDDGDGAPPPGDESAA